MDRWLLMLATLLAAIGGLRAVLAVHGGRRSRSTVWWIAGAFVCQFAFLLLRGEARGACPLRDLGEILAYLAWSLTLFYLLVGPAYRISLLGMFTAPVVVGFQLAALIPGVLTAEPPRVEGTNPWGETHSATAVLAYGAFALAGVAGVMFLVLDHQLKEHHLKGGLFRNLPPVPELLVSLERLLWIGFVLLTVGIVAGFLMPRGDGTAAHFVVALAVWAGYALLLGVKKVRGLTGRRLSLAAVLLFVGSWLVFAFI